MSTGNNFNTPTGYAVFGENIGTISNSTNYRLVVLTESQKMLEEEIRFRNSMSKKYTRFSNLTNGVEYALILTDIVLGAVAAAIPGVGGIISATATFSGAAVVSGIAKVINHKLSTKKAKHDKLSTIAATTLNNVLSKISKSISDGEVSHAEFIDVQNTINDWKNDQNTSKKSVAVDQTTLDLLNQKAVEQAQKDLVLRLTKVVPTIKTT
jgi:hypothetical protein